VKGIGWRGWALFRLSASLIGENGILKLGGR